MENRFPSCVIVLMSLLKSLAASRQVRACHTSCRVIRRADTLSRCGAPEKTRLILCYCTQFWCYVWHSVVKSAVVLDVAPSPCATEQKARIAENQLKALKIKQTKARSRALAAGCVLSVYLSNVLPDGLPVTLTSAFQPHVPHPPIYEAPMKTLSLSWTLVPAGIHI
jgi:hypothetical protein